MELVNTGRRVQNPLQHKGFRRFQSCRHAKSQSIAENYITQGVVGIFGCNEGSTTGAGNAIKAAGNADIIGVGFDKSDAILNLIDDGYLLCTMAQNPDVMGSEGVKAAVKAINGEELGGEVTDTGVSVITKDSDK